MLSQRSRIGLWSAALLTGLVGIGQPDFSGDAQSWGAESTG